MNADMADSLLVTDTAPVEDLFGWTTFGAKVRKETLKVVDTATGPITAVHTMTTSLSRASRVLTQVRPTRRLFCYLLFWPSNVRVFTCHTTIARAVLWFRHCRPTTSIERVHEIWLRQSWTYVTKSITNILWTMTYKHWAVNILHQYVKY